MPDCVWQAAVVFATSSICCCHSGHLVYDSTLTNTLNISESSWKTFPGVSGSQTFHSDPLSHQVWPSVLLSKYGNAQAVAFIYINVCICVDWVLLHTLCVHVCVTVSWTGPQLWVLADGDGAQRGSADTGTAPETTHYGHTETSGGLDIDSGHLMQY